MAFYNKVSDFTNFQISFSRNPQQDFGIFAKGYAQAASSLAELILAKPRFADYEAFPVVFLYRHAFELYLKGFYYRAALISHFKNTQRVNEKGVTNHPLKPLATIFLDICLKFFLSDQPLLQLAQKAMTFADDIDQIDSQSISFRYPITKKGKPTNQKPKQVNLLAFHQSMKKFLNELAIVDFGLDATAFRAQELFEILQQTQGEIDPDWVPD